MVLHSYYNDLVTEAGVDEVGRGCLAGVVVAAAVILPKNYQNAFIKDSKKLSLADRTALAQEIKEVALAYAIAEGNLAEIAHYNIANASMLAMHRAIEQLNPQPEHLLIDGNRFLPYPALAHTCFVKGDGLYLPIAAASIIAKDYRDKLMKSLAQTYPYYDWENNVGYGTPRHIAGLRKHGLSPWHRYTFKLKGISLAELFT